MDKNSRKAWEKRPDESQKAFDAFLTYIKMPIRDLEDDTNNRTLANLSKKLGYSVAEGKAASTLEGWSSKYDWQDRATAYDMHKANLSIEVVDASLAQFQENVIERRTLQTTLLNNIVEAQIEEIMTRQKAGYPLDALEINRLIDATKKLDDLERRIAGLPTAFTSDKVEEPDLETKTFVMGG